MIYKRKTNHQTNIFGRRIKMMTKYRYIRIVAVFYIKHDIDDIKLVPNSMVTCVFSCDLYNDKAQVETIYTEFPKAFDGVNHSILLS